MNAIITGATKGIGRATARHLAANNYNLALCARNLEDLQELRNELKDKHPHLDFFISKADCGIAEELVAFADFVKNSFSFTDVLVNNAGLYIPSALFEEEKDTLELQMRTNVYAAHYLCKVFGKHMKQNRKGHIFNVCSIASVKPFINAASYSVTKFALLGLTKVLREDLMQYGVKVTAILPGATLTESWAGTKLPAERFVSADDVALSIINCLSMSKGANVDEIIIRPVEGKI
ncbi:MAG: SDR family oxidoreductase [Daejeonella sp.]